MKTDKMIERSKTSLKPVAEKGDVSDGKVRPTSRCRSSMNKRKMEEQSSRKTLAGSLPADAGFRNYDQQLKLKLMDLTPRNRAKETSEGVQEFIKHVSDIIEQKNPFKESAVCSWPRGSKKNLNSPVIDSIQFNGVSKGSAGKIQDSEIDTSCEVDTEEINKKIIRKLKYKTKINSVSVLKKDTAILKGKVNRPKSTLKNREQRDKKQGKETSSLPLRVESKPIRSLAARKDGQDHTPSKVAARTHEEIAGVPEQNQRGRGRPSEIPLRKDRKDLSRKPKPLTLEHLNEVERKTSFKVKSKSGRFFSPALSDFDCSELQMTINLDLSSEKINIIGEEFKPLMHSVKEKTSVSLKPGKQPRSSSVSKQLSKELLEENFVTSKKSKVIDLNEMTSSSFTVLRNNSVVLNRLESLHKKNVFSKDKSIKDSQIVLTQESSFNTLKGKTSKKNIHSRLSSKGNKPGLKLKMKSAKKEADSEKRTLRKLSKSKSTPKSPRHDQGKIKENGQVLGSGNIHHNPSDERFKTLKAKKDESERQRVRSARGQSATKKASISRDVEETDTTVTKPKKIETAVTGVDCESQKLERPKSVRNSLLSKIISERNITLSTEKKMERALYMDSVTEVPVTPPPTPNNSKECNFEREPEEDEWSSETVIINDKFTSERYQWKNIESEIPSQMITDSAENIVKEEVESAKHLSLVVQGTPLNIGEDEPPEGVGSPSVRKKLNIDLRTRRISSTEIVTERTNELNAEHSKDGSALVKPSSGSTDTSEGKEGKSRESTNGYSDLLSMEINEPGSLSLMIQKSCSSLKWKPQSRTGGNVTGARKKKTRSDAADRQSASASVVFNSDISLQNKNKFDAKVRSGLTKSSKREEKSDGFDDLSVLKLKRRNSEPYSFRGFVWKCADAATPKDHKASMSSLTSSLRHLNTDDIDDFIFWEAVPQKMTSCWEMSLYHFKRPWSVLSCSVFRDNRESSTPGLILENLRNGGRLSGSGRRFAVNHNERAARRKENPFDVEPSIAQKNIDIRNWLAALNFPTLPSTSNDAFNEGNFSVQTTIDAQNLNKSQATPKRRKVLPILKLSDETSEKKPEENKYRKSTKWCNDKDLTGLVRRKSGGFVTCEQYLNPEESTHRSNLTVNLCVYSKSAEESILVETSDRATVCEPRKYKSVEITSQPDLSISATIINSGAVVGDQLVERTKTKEKPEGTPMQEGVSGSNGWDSSLGNINIPMADVALLRPDINIWKYLFLITMFIITIHYCYLNSFMCHN